MNHQTFGTILAIFGIVSLVASFIVAAVSLITAIFCSKGKLAPMAGWLLFISFLLAFFIEIGYMITHYALNNAFGYGVTQWVYVFLGFIYLLTGLLLVAAFALFRVPKPAEAAEGKEAAHA